MVREDEIIWCKILDLEGFRMDSKDSCVMGGTNGRLHQEGILSPPCPYPFPLSVLHPFPVSLLN